MEACGVFTCSAQRTEHVLYKRILDFLFPTELGTNTLLEQSGTDRCSLLTFMDPATKDITCIHLDLQKAESKLRGSVLSRALECYYYSQRKAVNSHIQLSEVQKWVNPSLMHTQQPQRICSQQPQCHSAQMRASIRWGWEVGEFQRSRRHILLFAQLNLGFSKGPKAETAPSRKVLGCQAGALSLVQVLPFWIWI